MVDDCSKVLIVDDDFAFRQSLRRILNRAGYQVKTAASGKQALRQFKKSACPVVFLDVNLPDQSGFSVLGKIRKTAPATKVIMVTVDGDSDLCKAAMNQGAFAFMSKPFKMQKLLNYTDRAMHA